MLFAEQHAASKGYQGRCKQAFSVQIPHQLAWQHHQVHVCSRRTQTLGAAGPSQGPCHWLQPPLQQRDPLLPRARGLLGATRHDALSQPAQAAREHRHADVKEADAFEAQR